MHFIRNALIALATVASTTLVCAQDYPSKPMSWVVPFAAGGPTDALARNIKTNFQQVVSLSPLLSDDLQTLATNITEPGRLEIDRVDADTHPADAAQPRRA